MPVLIKALLRSTSKKLSVSHTDGTRERKADVCENENSRSPTPTAGQWKNEDSFPVNNSNRALGGNEWCASSSRSFIPEKVSDDMAKRKVCALVLSRAPFTQLVNSADNIGDVNPTKLKNSIKKTP